MAVARTGESWDIVLRRPYIESTLIDDDTEDVTVTYVLTLDGSTVGSGSLAWEAHGYTDAWVKRISLPGDPGLLKVAVTLSATISDENATGRRQQTIKVID